MENSFAVLAYSLPPAIPHTAHRQVLTDRYKLRAMFRLWADDMFHFWLFSNSIVAGLDSFRIYAKQWEDPDFRGTRFRFKDLRIRFSRTGDVAWYSCFLDDCGSFRGKESCLENVFQTGVLEKRDGVWVHTLMHGSYPVDKIPENYARKYYSNLFDKKE